MYHFRGGLIRALVRCGIAVTVIVPPGPWVKKLESLGASCIPVPMQRFLSPWDDFLLLGRLYKIFKMGKFDIVHNMTIKPNLYGTFAATLARVKQRVCLVSGGGYLFLPDLDSKMRLVQVAARGMYKVAMALSSKVWFQNPDDLETFVNGGLIAREKGVVIKSGGIDLDEYSRDAVNCAELEALRQELNIPPSGKCVLMVSARLIWSKGVREFVEASAALRRRHPNWYFVIVGPRDDNSPDSVSQEYMDSRQSDRLIVLDKFRTDVRNLIAVCDIMTLPSYYPEGVPRSLLEGLAMGKPLITTDHPGCCETVENGKNGFLVPTKDNKMLAEKLELLIRDDDMRVEFGKASREKAVSEFSQESVINRVMRDLYGLTPALEVEIENPR